ncbi:MAG TPA: histidine kinase dimerization/phospho-acceptor domain-containing protein, partial [Cyclobacteriaceae bacterium]|nr:histidine kinase dimerization/phospho-acceptor domain-containing protein [Cyclobacteriaceae bacterium]
MKIKTKIALGVALLFGVMLATVGISIFYMKELSGEAKNILKDNYESLQYTQKMIEACDTLQTDSARAFAFIEKNLRLQEQNITEPGEAELTLSLRKSVERLRINGFDHDEIAEVRRLSFAIQNLNMQAIVKKNEIALGTADSAVTYLIIIGSVISLLAFTFVVNFPGYIANPIVALTNSIKSIANKDYEERLRFDRKDEFGELAEAFNTMAAKMDEYEHSNLAQILFEKKRIETIINRMSDPVIGLDENRKIVFANDQALALLNLNLTQVLGKYAPDVAVENDLLRNLIRVNGEERELQSRLIKIIIGGRENYFSKENIAINLKPTGEKNTQPIGYVILLKNVTPYKELDLAKTNFIATVSHELKTPIASLMMGIKLLHDTRVGTLNDEQTHIVNTLNEEAARLSKITHELLDLAQVETGNIKLNLNDIRPEDVVHFALEAVKFHAERKHVTIDLNLPDNLPSIRADMDKTTWVLVNLLTNAIRYSPENGNVVLSCAVVNNIVRFTVKDFGPGIESRYMGRLFEKFFQVPGSPSGTGLGLAISKEFIEAQG